MASLVWILLIFACSAQGQYSSHFHGNLEDLHHELEQYISGIEALELSARQTLDHVYTLKEEEALNKHRRNTEAMLLLANKRRCDVPTLLMLNDQSVSWKDRFTECMNLTKRLVDYENVTVQLYEEYLEIRPMFCDGANNISLCLQKDSSIADKMMCSYQGIEASLGKFQSLRKKTADLVNFIQNLVSQTVDEFKNCFGLGHESFFAAQHGLIEKSC